MEKYLGSGLIKGVGPKFAGRIVKTFGTDTLQIIEDEPDRLIEVPGIGKKRVSMIKQAWQEQKEVKNIMLFLQDHGVGTAHAVKIFKAFGAESIQTVKENPFKLTEIWGIGFKTADTVAEKMGFDCESFYRCRSGLLYVLNECYNDGLYDGECFFIPPRLPTEHIKDAIIQIYKAVAKSILKKKVAAYAKRMSVSPTAVRINSARTRWGSCSARNSLNFTWRLVMADEDIIDYVVVHELAHITEHNHSPRFWAVVEGVLPDYKQRKQRLRLFQEKLSNENWD